MIQFNAPKKEKKVLNPIGFQRCLLKMVKDAGGAVDITCEDLDSIPKDEALAIRYNAEDDSFHLEKVVVKKGKILQRKKRLILPN